MFPSGEKVVMVPVPSIALVLTVVDPAAVVVVVVDSCATAVPSAKAQAAPATNNFVNVFCFMFVLWFG
jgi:hypothetical protein